MNDAMRDREVAEVLTFWFEETRPEQWYKKDAAFDETIRTRFGALHERLARGVPPSWLETPKGCLAAVVVLDQFSRNMFRGDPRAFATDAAALATAEHALARGFDRALTNAERQFLYTPFEHSEDAAMQARSVELFAAVGDAKLMKYIERHKEIIDRFGRFPHRNAILGRPSTDEELAFLEEPDSSF